MPQEVHYSARRRPLTSHSPSQPFPPPPYPPPPYDAHPPRPLRPSKSAAQLRPETRDHWPPPPPLPPKCTVSRHQQHLELDSPLPPPPAAPFAAASELRRVQSSSVLVSSSSAATASADRARREETTSTSSKWKTAIDEAQYFAGGLIGRPSESTRHYTIIRHSHALVWYRGPSTSVSISILADAPLPAARSVWLQAKGFSGDVGMAVKALVGSTSTWLDVTPARQATPDQLPDVDERGVQRDLQRFAKRASGRTRAHVPRETHLVRIPATAADGYFRLVVCAGQGCGSKVLCGSPVFRIASTSTDVAVVRGASLATMPIEVGVKVASTIGQQVAKKYLGVAGAVVNTGAQKALKSPVLKNAGRAAQYGYRNFGVAAALQDGWNKSPQLHPAHGQMLEQTVALVGSDAGPEAPFPLRFDGTVVRGSGWSTAELGFPTANLVQVPGAVTAQLRGVFAAWARIVPAGASGEVAPGWHEAVVTIAPPRDAPPSVAVDSAVWVHVAHDFDGATFFDARLKVMLMGFLHHAGPAAADDMAGAHVRDVVATLASLGREAWAPREAVARIETGRGEGSFPDRLNEAAGRARQQVDRLPLHWAGVRSEAGALRDRMYGNGGLWIAR
ncbi:riboflavin kinase domain-containing protein [Hirsutella rhossiliensis]|uniref:Riboflavin kinase n=1 Tax=Hirsutella rhossiliensis TaxID=111463 RepID=A0A9P8N0Z2_9HYPO|nr:riboflavin kinase domain-containing protein [Hirsutella rhossiliensis]KAH0966143.1 riboflavin kinase domain-containing protein [Hirsutella rhossiliensis]